MSIESRSIQYGGIFGDWHIEKLLGSGSGGKSAVFSLYRDNNGWREYSALKVISLIEERGTESALPEYRRNEYTTAVREQRKSADQEVRLMDQLRGKTNIVDYLDHRFFSWADDSGFGVDLLIRMEKLTDLRSQLRQGRHFTEAEVIKIGKDICQALIICHGKSILHRDIKPENIFFNKDLDYKLGDFGISRILDVSSSLASTGVGTPQYWAPEQISGKYDERVDIYSLGLVLYELSNRNLLPFATTSYIRDSEVQTRMLGAPLPVPSGAGEALAKVILKACAYRPEDRYQSASEFLAALNSIVASVGTASPVAAAPVQEPYATVPASAQVQDGYRTAPAVQTAENPDAYGTMPAEAHHIAPPQDAYGTMPAEAHHIAPPQDAYGTMPAEAHHIAPPRDAYGTMPATGYAPQQDAYGTVPAEQQYAPAGPRTGGYETAPADRRTSQQPHYAPPQQPNTASNTKPSGSKKGLWALLLLIPVLLVILGLLLSGFLGDFLGDIADKISDSSDPDKQTDSVSDTQPQNNQEQETQQPSTAETEPSTPRDITAQIMAPTDRVAAGGRHSVVILPDGTAVASGDNSYGACNIQGWTDMVSVSAGDFFTVGLRSDGTVVAVGDNQYGQCSTYGWMDMIAVTAGDYHTVGLRSDGSLAAVGWNEFGQCNVAMLQNSAGSRKIIAIGAGYMHTVALYDDGTVNAIGSNEHGQCNVYGWTDIVAVYAGANYTLGLRGDGSVVATGSNNEGQCNVSGWRDVVILCAGDAHTVAITSDGTILSTGRGGHGQLNLSGWKDIVAINAGRRHTVGVTASGKIYATGENDFGQCNISQFSFEVAACPYDYSQKLVVTAPMGSSYGRLTLYAWENGDWVSKFTCDAAVGRNGIGSDYGEGKRITPQGLFKLGIALSAAPISNTGWPFKLTDLDTCVVDDVNSPLYNTIQSIASLPANVSYDPIGYTLDIGDSNVCIYIEHNGNGITGEGVVPGRCSAITLCGVPAGLSPTPGCVDISGENMNKLLALLDYSKNPHIEIKIQ